MANKKIEITISSEMHEALSAYKEHKGSATLAEAAVKVLGTGFSRIAALTKDAAKRAAAQGEKPAKVKKEKVAKVEKPAKEAKAPKAAAAKPAKVEKPAKTAAAKPVKAEKPAAPKAVATKAKAKPAKVAEEATATPAEAKPAKKNFKDLIKNSAKKAGIHAEAQPEAPN